MPSPGDLIEALRRRTLRPAPRDDDANGWHAWLAARSLRARGSAFPAAGIVEILADRPLRRAAPSLPGLGRLAAFGVLWRQQWEPAARDERGTRRAAVALSLVLHIGFAIALLRLLTVGIARMQAPDAASGETLIEVTFVGEARPQADGGGADAPVELAPTPVPTPVPPEPVSPAPPVAAVDQEVQPPPAATPDTPLPPVEAPAVPPQPLQVTEVPAPDSRFTLPPPPTVAVPVPRVATPVIAARSRAITVVEPVSPPPSRPLPQRTIAAPDLPRPVAEIPVRDVPAPLPALRPVRLPDASVAPAPRAVQAAPAVAIRDLPMPAAAPAAPLAATVAGAPKGLASGTATAPRDGSAAATPGAGPASPPGAPAPRAGDAWATGTGARAPPGGGAPGLFNADGSPRLAGGGRVGGGLPPGTVTEDFEKIDRMGTWLKRPPTDYEPTSFDRFWVPSENLLEEWVRRSIRTVMIPIPGTSKQLRCDVSLLALGGGCGISDANMQDVEAGARPPPDVPFKPELQDDPGAL